MRSVDTNSGFSIIVSNAEYSLVKAITKRGKVPVSSLGDYYQELGEKLYSRGALCKITEDGTDYFSLLSGDEDKDG